ncbi:MAG: glycosyltransferase family 4 protein [Acidobacteria bacterium]|nr:glycosyltransferase family 4 protein [Acidobacteriota bacterium]
MKFTILTQYYLPEIGAPQARLSALVAGLLARGHEVTVLTALPNYPLGKIYAGYSGFYCEETIQGAKVLRTFIYPTQKVAFIPRITSYLSFTLSSLLIGAIKLPASDYLLVESPPLFLGFTAYILSKLKRAKFIFNVSDLWPESAVQLGVLAPDSLMHRVSLAIEKFCYHQSWLVTGQSRGIIEDIQQRFPDCHVFHLSNGVDTKLFVPTVGQSDDSTCTATYAGLHGIAQGLDQIISAAELLRTENCRFVLVGDGPEKQELKARAQRAALNNVAFLDSKPKNEIPSLLASADILLVTLKKYIPGAVPSKLYEAMACGKPVIFVGEGEGATIVKENNTGLVVIPGDITGLADALRRLSREPALRAELGNNGRQTAVSHFDRQNIISRFVDYLEKHL